MFAIDDSTSSDWAREMRGTASMASTVIGRVASCSTSSGFSAGEIRLIRVAPSRRAAISAWSGAFTLSTTSAAQTSSADPTLGAGLRERRIGEARGGARAGLDDYLVAQLDELADRLRRRGDARFSRQRLSRNPDDHRFRSDLGFCHGLVGAREGAPTQLVVGRVEYVSVRVGPNRQRALWGARSFGCRVGGNPKLAGASTTPRDFLRKAQP